MPDEPQQPAPENVTVSWTKGFSVFQNFYLQAGFAGIVAFAFLLLLYSVLYTGRQDTQRMLDSQREDTKYFLAELKEIRDKDQLSRQKTNAAVREHKLVVEEAQRTVIKFLEKITDVLARWDASSRPPTHRASPAERMAMRGEP